MFIAKFSKTSDDTIFSEDKNGNLPYIGQVVAGTANGTLVNGTIFEREDYKTGRLYLCQNEITDYEDPKTGKVTKQVNVIFLSEVSPLEAIAMVKELGKPQLKRVTQSEEVEVEDPLV